MPHRHRRPALVRAACPPDPPRLAGRRSWLRRGLALPLAAAVAAAAGGTAAAATATTTATAPWPSRALRIVLPYPPGASSDALARALGEKLAAALGQPVLVEARPGANGLIATEAVARSTDGHTLLLVGAGHVINTSLYPRLPYDPARDLQPVAMLAAPGPMVLAVNAQVPARSVAELLALARQQPGRIGYASAGIGNPLHLAGEMLAQAAGVQLLHVPYKGAAPALNDLAGGQVQLMFNAHGAVAPLVKEGRVRLLAQTGAQRSPLLPAELPTLAEAGLRGLEISAWFGLLAPAALPADAVQRLHAEVARALATPELQARLAALGAPEPPPQTVREFGNFLAAETERYAQVIRRAGLKLEAAER